MPLFEPGAQTALYGPVQWSGRLRTLLGMMQSAESEPESPGMIYLTLILHYVEQECRSEKQDIRPRNETVEQICAYLAANYQQKFSLTDVAARFYLSPYYLSRLFRRVTGQSIVDYINGRRIEAAQRLLESTDLNISAVAEQTGFCLRRPFPPRVPRDDGNGAAAIPQEPPRIRTTPPVLRTGGVAYSSKVNGSVRRGGA